MSVIDKIKAKAKLNVKHIVLAEGSEPRTVQAARQITDQGIAKVTLLGAPEEITKVAMETGTDIPASRRSTRRPATKLKLMRRCCTNCVRPKA
jgi:phosphotransacetylase